MRPKQSLTFLTLAALGSSGCSFFSVYGPAPSQKPVVDVSCTEERYAPALDAAQGGTALLYAAGADVSREARLGLVVGALLWGGSAIYGYITTTECARAKDAAHRYQTKLMLRQIDLLNEAASHEDAAPAAPPAAPVEEAPPPPPEALPPPPIQ